MLQKDQKCHWWVSDTPGQKRGWLWHYSSHSKTLPTRGWQYADGGTFQDDLTLAVTPGPLTLPRQPQLMPVLYAWESSPRPRDGGGGGRYMATQREHCCVMVLVTRAGV